MIYEHRTHIKFEALGVACEIECGLFIEPASNRRGEYALDSAVVNIEGDDIKVSPEDGVDKVMIAEFERVTRLDAKEYEKIDAWFDERGAWE